MLIHRIALELAHMCAEENTSTQALAAILIEPSGHVTVCDGSQYLRISAKVEEPGLFDCLIPLEERQHDQAIILPADAAASFNAALKKSKKTKGEVAPSVSVSLDTDGHIKLASSDGRTMRRFDVTPPEQPYPHVANVFRDRVVTKEAIFGVDLLLDVVKTLKACGCQTVTLSFAEGEGAPVKVEAWSTIGPIEGAIMPRKR